MNSPMPRATIAIPLRRIQTGIRLAVSRGLTMWTATDSFKEASLLSRSEVHPERGRLTCFESGIVESVANLNLR